jgi:hypothetical protein
MLLYALKRLLFITPVAIGVSIFCFLLVHIAPGDPLDAILPADATPELIEQKRAVYGFDQPLPVQYAAWLWIGRRGGDRPLQLLDQRETALESACHFRSVILFSISRRRRSISVVSMAFKWAPSIAEKGSASSGVSLPAATSVNKAACTFMRAGDRFCPLSVAFTKPHSFLPFGRIGVVALQLIRAPMIVPQRLRQCGVDPEAATATGRLYHLDLLLQALQTGAQPTRAHGEGILFSNSSSKAASPASVSVTSNIRARVATKPMSSAASLGDNLPAAQAARIADDAARASLADSILGNSVATIF